MKQIGLLLITVGFLAGTLAAIVDTEHVRWGYFAAALAVGVAGVFVARSGHHKMHKSEEKLSENMQAVEAALGNIVRNISALDSEKHSVNTYDVRFRIDELFSEDLAGFVEARRSIAHVYGLVAYGDVMSRFAAGERYLNRVWSASADGYIDEVNAYLEKAKEQFVQSLEKIRLLKLSQPA
ncbi:MAG: hypothetical protein P8Z79_12320 [Sedimentisphaerales bacterium]|jgi:uncharacterized membrane protein YeaQ/YmgE (transglycosylase-associated protein family)